ncbi:S-adenosylmethionine:tRNA ribosyltransferase-isomerase [Microlunatus soli]|uniref:S-adenosylmethionine:tRNA ribosyltransferase-isomerase n=1 Tax=Microlunatus soli TaxID=630515 RepID=A0A1H1M5Z1_9ACTN|nr:S-adenosylmethionine:tRNA ribosyltransferase-isomerase [Microlunatus soli]SDR82254.1 S-adenosylmethionine:tRNA ribosyltransferase-isomerase [Microlunatus soli]
MSLLTLTPTTVFPAPAAATAPRPAEERGLRRDEVRMLIARDSSITHARFHDLPAQLDPGDLLVVNDSATIAAECDARIGEDPVVLHVASRLGDHDWAVELRTAPDAARAILDAAVGTEVVLDGDDGVLELVAPYPAPGSSPTGRGTRLWRAAYEGHAPLLDLLDRVGRPIAYGYLDRRYPLSAYQTVFGLRPGSAEMPSASRPFTPELVTRLVAGGVGITPITLHTAVSSQEAGEAPLPEQFTVPSVTARAINTARDAGHRVVAVGTTAARAVESAVEETGAGSVAVPRSGWTDRVITVAEPPRLIDGLISGWHDPQASHLLLVEAVAGAELTQRAYDAAAATGYLWHEFGDSALLLPDRRTG